MFADFRRIFFPTPEEKEHTQQMIDNFTVQSLERRKSLKFIRNYKHRALFISKPFTAFVGDCCYCEKYENCDTGISEGGYCKLHKWACGWGFVCEDYTGKYPFDFKGQIVEKESVNNGWN